MKTKATLLTAFLLSSCSSLENITPEQMEAIQQGTAIIIEIITTDQK